MILVVIASQKKKSTNVSNAPSKCSDTTIGLESNMTAIPVIILHALTGSLGLGGRIEW